ncbi:IS91 family transposase [Bacillus sp. es.034]|uniref:IS91 family transposase n=1 Tax=Bacillus sp. es.034 TaxID=1761763 RepID=UPI000BF6CF4C|nr:IS91 family transposase [Bacillus sp. es.034]PFG04569.1 transposase-like zinc-binding protein [Bacillus sp. es.034]PFG07649.1 transposase-like zinc-binding protein [Bacillus sp. es.034]PFG07686.1 transposase-like zinc-binding protein [Bacillus sp. es.034]PFG07694.1 transposase-like zinc-binding protein [Bacillus sp. es.034]PFG07799.1 transposase-like zinc-binding protein [Bacillus sp. es.034]
MSTVQELFHTFYPTYKETYKLSMEQAKAATNMMNCRTAAMGGHSYECESCSHSLVRYNSCRNRHCTLCQGVNKDIWVDQRKKDILDAPYFHVVFTMPEQLHMLIYHNQKLLYDLMYKAVAETLTELAGDKKYLGAQIGFFSVLHTWGQNLHYHPHIHTVVLAGGLNDRNQWRRSSEKFFIPVKVLSKKFRGKYLYYLKQYYQQKQLRFFNESKKYQDAKSFQALIDECYQKDWYSYMKRTFSGPIAVMEYLGRYTHRIAISNNRIVSANDQSVTIQVKDYKRNNQKKTVTLKGVEFLRRFLMHILPKGFVKIRHYGLLANRNKKTKLKLCRKLTKSPTYKPLFEGLSKIEILSILIKKDVSLCPSCKKAHLTEAIP